LNTVHQEKEFLVFEGDSTGISIEGNRSKKITIRNKGNAADYLAWTEHIRKVKYRIDYDAPDTVLSGKLVFLSTTDWIMELWPLHPLKSFR
jgi:hypothetical protein